MGCKTAYEAAYPWSNFWSIKEMDFSGMDAVAVNDGKLQISVENGTLIINGIDGNESITIYDMQGRIIYSGTDSIISNVASGIYIVKIGDKTAKFTI